MRAYMVFSDTPPPGYTSEDELLVSLTKADVIEAYAAWEANIDKAPGEWPYVWHELNLHHLAGIFAAVSDFGIDLESIFDGVLL